MRDRKEVKNRTEYYMWSDSQIVLAWIKSSKPLQQQFIQTRVAKIKDKTSSSHWEYYPTASNPVDLLTRGIDSRTFLSKTTSWFQGPSWLLKEKTERSELQHTKIHEQEHEETESTQTISYLATTAKSSNLLNVIDIAKYGTLTEAIQVKATVMKFISRLRKGPELETQITNSDMKKALAALIRAVQQSAYSGIITQLQINRMTNLPPLVGQLGLYIDKQKLLRCRGRLKNAPLQDNTKYSILIPKDTYLAELIIRAIHLMLMHAGVRETLTQLRQTYWILKGRQLVKRILHQCVTCKKAEGRPFRSVNFPPLPQPRVTGSQPFQVAELIMQTPCMSATIKQKPLNVIFVYSHVQPFELYIWNSYKTIQRTHFLKHSQDL